MFFTSRTPAAYLLAACAFSALTPGCFDTSSPETTVILEDKPGEDGAPIHFGIQSWGVGSAWYDYDSNMHIVTPADEAWYLVRDDEVWHLSITQYYNEDGKRGHPNMIVHRWNDADNTWTQTGEWSAIEHVRDLHQCFQLADPANAKSGDECSTFDYDIMWRADFRTILEAGFSIANPGFYVATDKGGEVYNVKSKALPPNLDILNTNEPEVTEDGEPTTDGDDTAKAIRVLSIFDHDAVSILEARFFLLDILDEETGESRENTNTVMSLTGDKHGAQWRFDQIDDEITLSARCIAFIGTETTTPEGSPTFEGDPQTLSFSIGDDADNWTLIDFCGESGPEIVTTLNVLRPGNWPSNDTFDLAFQKTDEGYTVWLAPEQTMMPIREGGWEPTLMDPLFWE